MPLNIPGMRTRSKGQMSHNNKTSGNVTIIGLAIKPKANRSMVSKYK